MSVFKFQDIADFIQHWMQTAKPNVTGIQSRIAEQIGCQPAYLSQVLYHKANLSPEQSEAMARFMGLSQIETDYLMLLCLLKRSGTQELKRYYQKKIEILRKSQLNLKRRVQKNTVPVQLGEGDLAVYYSSWVYAAVHVALGNPDLQTVEALARYFRCTDLKIREVIHFLEDKQLISKTGQKWKVAPFNFHLEKGSKHLVNHQKNIHNYAFRHLDEVPLDSDLSYGVYMTVSKEDAYQIKNLWAEALEKTLKIVGPSKDETVCCMYLGLLEMGKAPG